MRVSRVRLTVPRMMVAVAVMALAGALVVERQRHTRREAELGRQLVYARAGRTAPERMLAFLSDTGIVTLGEASEAEVLRVIDGPPSRFRGYPVTETGEVLGGPFVRRLAGVLLDAGNYIYLNADALPTPDTGVRLRRGKECVDILFSVHDGHTDVWAFPRERRGEFVPGGLSHVSFYDDALGRLVRESLMK
jgi:hypothetical protein